MQAMALCIVFTVAAAVQGAAVQTGIEQLHRIDLLPQFRASVKVGSFSSYDRRGGNNDGFSGEHSFIRQEPGGLVLAELQGPGVIYRIWATTRRPSTANWSFTGQDRRISTTVDGTTCPAGGRAASRLCSAAASGTTSR